MIRFYMFVVGAFFYWYNTIKLTSFVVDETRKRFTKIDQKTSLKDLIVYEMIDKGVMKEKGAYFMDNKKNFDVASRLVEKQLDIEKIVKNSMQLEVIKNALIKPYQKALIPYIVIKEYEIKLHTYS